MWNDDNAIYDDGEWITWTEINSHLERLEFEARFPDLDADLVPIFQSLLSTAQDYYELTGRHLQVYGDIGELYGVITHGLKLHRNYAQGSDGKIGNHFVEVKTITPFKSNDVVALNLKRNFSKVLIVKVSADFEVRGSSSTGRRCPRSRATASCSHGITSSRPTRPDHHFARSMRPMSWLPVPTMRKASSTVLPVVGS